MDTKDDIDNPKAPFLEKSNHPGLANDEIYDEERNPSNRRTASRHYLGVRDRHRALMIFHVFLLCLNLILFAMVWVSGSQSYDLRRGAGIIYCESFLHTASASCKNSSKLIPGKYQPQQEVLSNMRLAHSTLHFMPRTNITENRDPNRRKHGTSLNIKVCIMLQFSSILAKFLRFELTFKQVAI